MKSYRLIFLLWSLTLSAAFELDPNIDADDLVNDVAQTQILRDSLVQANVLLHEQIEAEVYLNVSENLPLNCQRAHAGFHAKSSKEVFLRGKVARLLEIATLQATAKLETGLKGLRRKKRQLAKALDISGRLKRQATFANRRQSQFIQSSGVTRFSTNNRFQQSSATSTFARGFSNFQFPPSRFGLRQPGTSPSPPPRRPNSIFVPLNNGSVPQKSTPKPSGTKLQAEESLTLEQIDKLLDEALEKLKQDHERGITTKTSLTLPNVKLLPGGLSTLPTNNSGLNINDEESLNSILDLLNKTATDGCALENDKDCDVFYPYRSFSGRCNNLDTAKVTGSRNDESPSHKFGTYNSPYVRFLPAQYDDNVQAPRTRSVLGIPLPTAREVSNAIHASKPGINQLDKKYTLALMQWGQYIDHDLTATALIHSSEGSLLDCSKCPDLDQDVPGCFPIRIKANDTFFNVDKHQCIPFTRAQPGQTSFGPREQLNQVTAYIDASSVYGSDLCRSKELRNGSNLVSTAHPLSPKIFKDLLPRKEQDQCASPTGKCFHAGDDRSSEQPGLTSIHTIFTREHNRLAFKIKTINPEWDEETVFQEVRKIIVATHQHITYNEFLPRILGPKLMSEFELNPSELYNENVYDHTCKADVYNEFAVAAFRFGHSLVRPDFTLMTNSRTEKGRIRLRDHFHNPDVMMKTVHFIDELTNGLVSNSMANFDNKLTEELTNHLFEEPGKPFSGMDLASINIQRGRDHGLPGYSSYAKVCSEKLNLTYGSNLTNFSDLRSIMGVIAAQDLGKVYSHVDDIDLFTGGLSEIPLDGALIGPTFGCILAFQFKTLKKCDRFWYETPDERIGFSAEQISQIKKETLASVLCRNSDIPTQIQRNAFDLADSILNPLLECDDHRQMDLMMWKHQDQPSVARQRGSKSAQLLPPYCDLMGRSIGIGTSLRVSACVECTCRSQISDEPQCLSVQVSSCSNLLSEVGLEAIKVDPACQSQCPQFTTTP